MKSYFWYSTDTGYGYDLTEHAKLRMWERFRTLDIDHEFELFCKLMVNDSVDDRIISNMEEGDEFVIKDMASNKVYVVVLSKDLVVRLKTVYKDGKGKKFKPYPYQTLYYFCASGKVIKDITR